MSNQGDPTLGNLAFVEQLYAQYIRDPQSLSSDWQTYFTDLDRAEGAPTSSQLGPSFVASGTC